MTVTETACQFRVDYKCLNLSKIINITFLDLIRSIKSMNWNPLAMPVQFRAVEQTELVSHFVPRT